jgi:hypothetical protein
MERRPIVISEDIRRDAHAELGDVVLEFYMHLLEDTTSPRIREAVHQVLEEAAAAHRAGGKQSVSSRRAAGARARRATASGGCG